jgi:hypothetical protein
MSMSPEALAKSHANALRVIAKWSEERQVDWSERAAVLEYERSDTCKSRTEAELVAYWQFLKEGGR